MGLKIEENVNQLLEVRDWTIYRLSKESGVSLTVLYSLGSKKRGPNAETLLKISDALDVTVDWLLKGETK
ncbi:helix-turn-helix domain-containing protein [Paenibacillus polymyxa]|uniref:helix-turn-helix domain-containing protein n=1 Tax=Paenibacillus polymyxa TaxID=1406 RepID=UPI000737B50D|nr:helix-turn-helix domain-containing protein [Paenibacillus polymyxa]